MPIKKNKLVQYDMPTLRIFDNSACEAGKHTFYKSKLRNSSGFPVCTDCGADVVDWQRLHRRNIEDVEYTVKQLQYEVIRLEWWNKEFDLKAKNHALKKGFSELEKSTRRRLIVSIGTVHPMANGSSKPYRDGYQTPYSGNTIFFAQHALGCCCRKCVAVWHGIPNGRNLTEEEIEYFVNLIMFYLRRRLPELKD